MDKLVLENIKIEFVVYQCLQFKFQERNTGLDTQDFYKRFGTDYFISNIDSSSIF